MTNIDETIIAEGTQRLTDALSSGQVQRGSIEREQARDVAVVKAREWLGDPDDEQRLITHGIKLRIEARRRTLETSL